MSDQPEPAPAEPSLLAARRRTPRLMLVALVIVPVVVLSVVVGLELHRTSHRRGASGQAAAPASPAAAAATASAAARLADIRSLLKRRSAAVVHHNEVAFMSTVDPSRDAFRRDQARMFANLRRVRFASWSYALGSTGADLDARARRRYAAPTWAPTTFALHYRIAGFDSHPTELAQFPTFVRRAGRWYLGSLSDFRGRGEISATDLWDYGPVHVIRRRSVLVLGPRSELGTMTEAADQMQAAIPTVTAVWGRHWSKRVVVLVPSTQHEMAAIDDDHEDLNQIAALTSSEVSQVNGKQAPVGDRVTLNPRNWPKLGSLGSMIVLTHELTHVASRAFTTEATPKWLSEGFADYVGFLKAGVPATIVAAELVTEIRAGKPITALPGDRAFRGANKALSVAYEEGWLACRDIATRYGQHRLVRFYRAVGASTLMPAAAVSNALHQVLHLSHRQFVLQWRVYVREQLA